MQGLPDTALADFLSNYKGLFGLGPPLEKRPTLEQLTLFTRTYDDEPRGQVNAQGEYSIDLGNCDTMDEILEHFGADSVRPDHPCSRSRSSCCCCCRCCCC